MSKMTEAYLAAQAASYANQEGGVTIPPERLKEGLVTEIQLGFQPLGIAVTDNARGGDRIAIAAYFEPAVCLVDPIHGQDGVQFKVQWIRGVDYTPPDGGETRSVRLFPDIAEPGGANRAQGVMWYGDDLWVTRNTGRDMYCLSAPKATRERWRLEQAHHLLADPAARRMVHSIVEDPQNYGVITMESVFEEFGARPWEIFRYPDDENTPGEKIAEVPPQCYGFAVDGTNELYYVTDVRSPAPKGIYRLGGKKPLIPGICGNGLVLLENGSLLVTRYGQGFPGAFNGLPGALIYIHQPRWSDLLTAEADT